MTSEFSRVAALPPRRETRIECKIAHHMSRLFTHVLFVQKSIYVSPTTSSRRGDACTIASILRESQFKRFPFFPFFFPLFSSMIRVIGNYSRLLRVSNNWLNIGKFNDHC